MMSLHPSPDYCSPFALLTPSIQPQDLAVDWESRSQAQSVQLGWILIKNGSISPAQLAAALVAQSGCTKKLGELLMEQYLISEDQLRDALREQMLRQRGHWVI
jgi:hypothetical protein